MCAKKSKKQAAIDRELKGVYHRIDIDREPVCAGCGSGSNPLSHSHTISRKRCKDIGKPQLIVDPANIELMCFGTNASCHEVWEYEGIAKRMELNNFDDMMCYVELHDQERHTSLALAVKSVTKGLGNIT